KLILLQEEGVCDLPKLQGNLEYIPFDRSNLQKTFLKISQMISDMKSQTSSGTIEKTDMKSTIYDEPKLERQESKAEVKTKDKKEEVLYKIKIALYVDKDYVKAQKILNDEADALLDDDDKLFYRAFVLRVSHPLGDKNAFKKLQELVQENKDSPPVIKQLAYRYKEMCEFKKAKDQFLSAIEKYDVNDSDKKSGLVEAYVQAAWCLADDDLDGALSMLQRLLSNPNFQDFKAEIFNEMAEISKDKDNIERFFIYAEAALDTDPVNTSLRFDLAYTYSNENNNKLALLHYKRLIDAIKHDTAQNNIGAAYNALELKSKAVASYFKAAKEKQTISMGNLAHCYLEAGFVNDAKQQIVEANKLLNEDFDVHARVNSAQQKLTTLLENEDKKEREILLEAKEERKFRVDYSKAFCSEAIIAKDNIEGIWKTPWGEFELKFDEKAKSFSINGKKSVEKMDAYRYLIPSQTQPTKKYKDRHVKITGTLKNMSGKYKIEVEDKVGETLLTDGKVHEATGYMVINESYGCIEIMEKTKDNKIEFKQWKKHEEIVEE
ncbi:MAG: hypothetical protein H8E54_07895, partial [Candidatus Aminicenantes bacterium]|nr:hypothetical protein [Candidatus Aminicenantes bacterium]